MTIDVFDDPVNGEVADISRVKTMHVYVIMYVIKLSRAKATNLRIK